MAVPVLLGIPWLATALWTVFGSIVSFFGSYMAKRLAILSAVVTALISLTVAFVAAIEALVSTITYATPPMFTHAMSLIVPDNLDNCVAAIASAMVFRWVYDWKTRIVQLRLF